MKKLTTIILILIFNYAGAQNWNEKNKITANDRDAQDMFGLQVTVSGNIAAVGVPNESHDSMGLNNILGSGSVYIYERGTTGNWTQQQKIHLAQRSADDNFGCSVSLYGNLLLVGANGEDEDEFGGNTMNSSGAAYIYEKGPNGNWNLKQKIVASDRNIASGHFGSAVAISGNNLVIGVLNEGLDPQGQNLLISAGAAYIFELNSNGSWTETQKVVASDRTTSAWFGYSVSISGNSIICGAQQDGLDHLGQNPKTLCGSAYIFEKNQLGVWAQVNKLVAIDRSTYDKFGTSVSISGDYAIVGAPDKDAGPIGPNNMSSAGSAYIFKRNNSGSWLQLQKITASDMAKNDHFAISVSISGAKSIIGAMWEDDDANQNNYIYNAGSAYIYEMDTSGNWVEEQKIVASDRGNYDYLGCAVAISGNIAIVGAYGEEEDTAGLNHLFVSGSAYIFEQGCISNSQVYDTVCGSYISPSGNHIWTNSGTYTDIIQNTAGCDSIITVYLIVNNIDTSISQAGITLTANAVATSYQWLDCNAAYSIITGANSNTFTPIANGSYAVELTNNGCMDTSFCYTISTVGMLNAEVKNGIKIWPNPSSNFINLENTYVNEVIERITIYSIQGQEMLNQYVNNATAKLSLEGLKKGIYIIECKTESGKHYRTKFIKL